MRHWIVITVFLSSMELAASEASSTEAQSSCEFASRFASIAMQIRQDRATTLAEAMRDTEDGSFAEAVFLDAFDTPLMHTAETRDLVIEEFANKWALKCYQDGPFLANGAGE